jgi:hypothetical protein|nr:MAG TPA: hypothetical protein [Caudoviricetes sp.]
MVKFATEIDFGSKPQKSGNLRFEKIQTSKIAEFEVRRRTI